jgi:hypothetical protein
MHMRLTTATIDGGTATTRRQGKCTTGGRRVRVINALGVT